MRKTSTSITTTATELPTIITVKEAAALARVGQSTIYSMLNAGQLPYIRIGRTFRIRRQDFLRFLGLEDPA